MCQAFVSIVVSIPSPYKKEGITVGWHRCDTGKVGDATPTVCKKSHTSANRWWCGVVWSGTFA